MAHQEFTIDNIRCKRRFHFAFDDEQKTLAKQTITCPLCQTILFGADDHQPVRLTRLENLVNQVDLSDRVINDCTCSFK
jgi:hypothetical protein